MRKDASAPHRGRLDFMKSLLPHRTPSGSTVERHPHVLAGQIHRSTAGVPGAELLLLLADGRPVLFRPADPGWSVRRRAGVRLRRRGLVLLAEETASVAAHPGSG